MNIGNILKDLVSLKAGDENDFIVVSLDGSKVWDAIQAKKKTDGRYYVELLKRGGNPDMFNGNQIFSMPDMTEEAAIKLFTTIIKRQDKMPMPKGAKNITAEAANQ